MSQKVLDRLDTMLPGAVLERHAQFGDDTAIVDAARWKEVALFLRDDSRCSMDHFIDLTAVDYLNRADPRFEVVLHVRASKRLHRLRVKARLATDALRIDSLVEVWKGANWFERECFDMFGVEFAGHPDLRRILLYDEFEGHPLRKDYAAHKTQPLVDYREGVNNAKLPPFGDEEGMPFGRQTHDHVTGGRNLLGFEEDGTA